MILILIIIILKVILPSIFNGAQLVSNRLMRSIDEAKSDAADFVLMQICSNPIILQHQQQQPLTNSDETKSSVEQNQAVYANESALQQSSAGPLNPSALPINGHYQDLSILANQPPYVIDPSGLLS